jgi:hypothetical protein
MAVAPAVPTVLIVVAVVGLHTANHPDDKTTEYGRSPEERIRS